MSQPTTAPADAAPVRIDADELRRAIAREVIEELRPLLKPPRPSRAADFASRREMASILRISVTSLDRMTQEGCPSLLRGSNRLFVVDDVIAWLRDQTPEAEAKAAERQAAKLAVRKANKSLTTN